jgi:hypothetical protein
MSSSWETDDIEDDAIAEAQAIVAEHGGLPLGSEILPRLAVADRPPAGDNGSKPIYGMHGEALLEELAPLPPLAMPRTPVVVAATASLPTPTTPDVPMPTGWLSARGLGLTVEPPPLVGKGIIHRRGMTHLAGEDKHGKTQRILQLAAEGTHGLPIFGTFPVPHPFRTLLLEAELEWPELDKRLEDIATALNLDRQRLSDNFHIVPIPHDLAPKNESSPNVSAHGFWTRERGHLSWARGVTLRSRSSTSSGGRRSSWAGG